MVSSNEESSEARAEACFLEVLELLRGVWSSDVDDDPGSEAQVGATRLGLCRSWGTALETVAAICEDALTDVVSIIALYPKIGKDSGNIELRHVF